MAPRDRGGVRLAGGRLHPHPGRARRPSRDVHRDPTLARPARGAEDGARLFGPLCSGGGEELPLLRGGVRPRRAARHRRLRARRRGPTLLAPPPIRGARTGHGRGGGPTREETREEGVRPPPSDRESATEVGGGTLVPRSRKGEEGVREAVFTLCKSEKRCL